jgi:hypothetical protein
MMPGRLAAALASLGALGSLVLGPPASAGARSRAVNYSGHTSQRPGHYGVQSMPDNVVTFTVANGHVRDFVIPWVARCFDAFHGKPDAPLIDRSGFDPLSLRNGRISIHNGGYRYSPGPGQKANVQLVLSGFIHGKRASGTLSVQASIDVDGVYTSNFCSTAKPIRWRAVSR